MAILSVGSWAVLILEGKHMARYEGFASVNGPLVQFVTSATISAIRFAGRGDPTRLLIDAKGYAHDVWDPAWLIAEDCTQGLVGYGGVVYWDPDGEVSRGQAVTLVVEAYDLARRICLRVTVPMVAGGMDALLRTPTGPDLVVEIAVPEVVEPRYADWDLAKFLRWAEWELAYKARRTRKIAKCRGDARIPEQRYPEMAEYAGFAYIDQRRRLRGSGARTGRYWMGRAMSIVWNPGEGGAREQLLAAARARMQDEDPELSLAALWWSESGIVQARFADYSSRQVLAGTWKIEPDRGISGRFMRGIGLAENRVIPIAPPTLLEHPF
jgi:hypothetical protein